MNPHLPNNRHFGRTGSFLICTIVYLIAGVAVWFAHPIVAPQGPVLTALYLDILATVIVFIAAIIFRNSSLYDPYWSVAPVPIALFWWGMNGFSMEDLRQVLAFIALGLWAIRLTLNWARGWVGLIHEDWRYGMLRARTGIFYPLVNLGGIHLFPTVMVFLACMPLYYVYGTESSTFGWMDILGFSISILGTLLELVADEQLKAFKRKNTAHPEAFIDEGVWYYSRHPNYFGEILFWTGLFFMGLSASPNALWTASGWLAMFMMFQFISIPMMDERMVDKRPAYAELMKKSARLIPWFRK